MTDAEHTSTLGLIAARYTLDLIPSDDLPAIALELVEAGIASEALVELAGTTSKLDHPAELRRLFYLALEQCGVVPPRRLEAARRVIRQLAGDVVAGTSSPAAGAADVVQVFQIVENDLPHATAYVRDELGVARLCGLHDSLYDAAGDQRVMLEREIVDECRRLA